MRRQHSRFGNVYPRSGHLRHDARERKPLGVQARAGKEMYDVPSLVNPRNGHNVDGGIQ